MVVTAPSEGCTLQEAMSEVQNKFSVKDLSIDFVKFRRATTGALILEVPGQDSAAKADQLAARMSEILAEKGIRIARPVIKADIRLTGLDDSATQEGLAVAVARAAGCMEGDVRIGEIRRFPSSGLGSAWAQCPVSAAKKATTRALWSWVGGGRALSARSQALAVLPLPGSWSHQAVVYG